MNLIIKLLITILLLLPLLVFPYGKNHDSFIIFTFIITIVQSVILTFWVRGDGATLFKTYFSFSYVFFGVVPLLEYLNGVIYWGGGVIFEETYALVNVIISLANFYVFILYRTAIAFFNTSSFKNNNKKEAVIANEEVNQWKILLVISICFATFYYINNGSLLSMMFRGGEFKQVVEMERWLQSIVGTVVRFIPFLIFLCIVNNNKVNKLFKLFVFLTAVICASPLGMARFMVGLLYIPLLLLILPSLRRGIKLPATIMGSLVIVFPFLEGFRSYSGLGSINLMPKYSFFFSGHFDSYQSLARVIQIDYVTYGYQMLGSIFFFIPRNLWVEKPIGSGATIANIDNYSFSNVSMNFFGEGYINFGYLGIFLFATALAVFFAKVDHILQFSSGGKTIIPFFILIPFVYVLMRGDINVALSLLASVCFSYMVAVWATKK